MHKILISGGGKAGLNLGLTLHQIGVPFHLFESVNKPKPLGVGINLHPLPSGNCWRWVSKICLRILAFAHGNMDFILKLVLKYGGSRADFMPVIIVLNILCTADNYRWLFGRP